MRSERAEKASGREIVRKPLRYELFKLERGPMRKAIKPRTEVPVWREKPGASDVGVP